MNDNTRIALVAAVLALAAVASWAVLIGGFYLVVDVLFGWPS